MIGNGNWQGTSAVEDVRNLSAHDWQIKIEVQLAEEPAPIHVFLLLAAGPFLTF